jgi:hypothetical protein
MSTHHRLASRLTLCACAAGAIAPSAQAMHGPEDSAAAHSKAATPLVRPVSVQSRSFDWTDAGIGAAAGAGVAVLAGGAILLVGRTRSQQPAFD